MELLMQDVKMHSDDKQEDEEEEEEDEAEAEIARRRVEEISSNSKSKNNYLHHFSQNYEASLHRHQNSWLGLHHDHHHHSSEASTTMESHNSSPGLGFQSPPTSDFTSNHTKIDLSLGHQIATAKHEEEEEEEEVAGSASIEKEHMFDKVVTPSDVGKLNRLVIPKQHAEKYFPLDPTSNDKGLLLNFEDRNGKLWRFRYSYWNSSQSYVMTKGWSRFVKDKKLDAGDIVSFHRGSAHSHRHRLYIDWRRRPDHALAAAADPGLYAPFFLHQPAEAAAAIRWGGRLFSFPSSSVTSRPLSHGNVFPPHHNWQYSQVHHHGNQQQEHYNVMDYSRSGSSGSVYSNLIGQQGGVRNVPMIIDSVPVDHYYHNSHSHHQKYYHGKNAAAGGGGSNTTSNNNVAGKRLRLFGVNMECASSSSSVEESRCCNDNVTVMGNTSSIIPPPLPSLHHHHQYLRVIPNHEDHPISSSSSSGRFHQRGETSMLFDLDPSLHYSSSSRQ